MLRKTRQRWSRLYLLIPWNATNSSGSRLEPCFIEESLSPEADPLQDWETGMVNRSLHAAWRGSRGGWGEVVRRH
jgi:hypothetical protein